MIGNDLCFFDKSRSVKRSKKYLFKITTEKEREILSTLDPFLQVPFAWSIKEASYKYYRRNKQITLKPKKFRVSKIVHNNGEPLCINEEQQTKGFANYEYKESIVTTDYGKLICKSIITEHFIHTILSDTSERLDQTYWGIAKINSTFYRDQSNEVRKKAINHLLKINGRNNQYEFRKYDKQVPILFENGEASNSFFSFSHDKQYVGYAWHTPKI